MNYKMNIVNLIILAIMVVSCQKTQHVSNLIPSHLPDAPVAIKTDTIITFHNHSRTDPYFWMRLTDAQKTASQADEKTQQVLDYLNAENAYTEAVMVNTVDMQKKLFDEIVGRIKQTDESVPYLKNGYYYYTKYKEGQEYPIYCRKNGSLSAEEQVMLDVNTLAAGKAYYKAAALTVSPDNKILAFFEDTVSRRVYTARFKNLETGEFLSDELQNADPGGAWANDNSTFFYTTKNKVSLLSEKIWRHGLSNSQEKDQLVYEEKDPSFYIGVYKSKSGKYIIIENGSTLVSDHHILNADFPAAEFKQFTPREDVHEYSINHFKDKFYIVTNWNATNFRLMETSENATSKENWQEVLGNRDDVLLEGLDVFENHLVVSERSNALTHLRVINQVTKAEHYLDFGEETYVAYTSTNPEFYTSILRFGYSSMTTPNSTIDYNMNDKSRELKKQQEVVGGHDPNAYLTERHWAVARDGVKIPISVVYKKGIELSKNTPLLLYAYGSYGYTVDPGFSSVRLSLLDRGFVFAIAHIRGGQAMGRQWYEDGKLMKKINTFNDFIDCGKYLLEKQYTSSNHLYAMGGSAGGLLMGSVVNLEPELFNGVIAAVPFVDVVSTMLDETIPLTTNEFDEWGNPKNKEAYDYMLSYSPYDNVLAQDYPNLLITTGLFDSQVQYWEPAKWIAKLRDLKTDHHLLLMHTNMDAGHGGASGRFQPYKETAREYAFMFMLEGIEF